MALYIRFWNVMLNGSGSFLRFLSGSASDLILEHKALQRINKKISLHQICINCSRRDVHVDLTANLVHFKDKDSRV
jgi:hypothetical protein